LDDQQHVQLLTMSRDWRKSGWPDRDAKFLRPLGAILALLALAGSAHAVPNRVVEENRKAGTTDWLLQKVDTVLERKNPIGEDQPHFVRSPKIEGFASDTSYRAGERVTLYVNTDPVSDFSVDVYRLGWYQGLGGRHVMSAGLIVGRAQPTPEDGERNLRECRWSPSHSFVVPADWLSGVYLAKLTRQTDGYQAYVIFVVKDQRRADFNFQVSDLTWQAYNRWPAWRALYDFQGRLWNTSGGDIVGFDRPYGFFYNLLPSGPNPLTNGSGEFLLWEHRLAFWMEEQGYDVTYTSGIDTHREPEGLLRTKAFLSVGHDEYWTRQMYDQVGRARDRGVNLLFLSGNAVDGEIFLSTSTDGRPNRVMGRTKWFTDEAQLLGASSYGVGLGDWIVRQPDHWLYTGTGLREGDAIPNLIGWEYHGYPLKPDPTLVVVGEARFKKRYDESEPGHAATFYEGPKGNFVFNAGTCWWSMALSVPPGATNPPDVDFSHPDPRVQRMTKNLFDRVVASPAHRSP
jgi:hypothetical protein